MGKQLLSDFMKNIMETYNFLITIGKTQFQIDVDANTEDEAIDIIQKEYSIDDGYHYMLI